MSHRRLRLSVPRCCLVDGIKTPPFRAVDFGISLYGCIKSSLGYFVATRIIVVVDILVEL